MDNAPRFNFFSLTFLVGFGLGGFMGVLFGLLALALVLDDNEPASAITALVEPSATFLPGATPTPEPKVRTKSALDVRLGPGTAFAVVGTIPRGGEVEPVGRDSGSTWVAIRFPPGSTARGWVPVSEIENLSAVERLAVVQPTPLPRNLGVPDLTRGEPGARILTEDDPSGLNGLVSRTPSGSLTPGVATATPRPTGPTDLVASRASLLPDGRVQVLVGNRGPGELTGRAIFVTVRDLALRAEQMSVQPGTLPVGAQITLITQNFRIDRPTELQIIVDPFSNITDPDRSNNQLSITLTPALLPSPTRNPND